MKSCLQIWPIDVPQCWISASLFFFNLINYSYFTQFRICYLNRETALNVLVKETVWKDCLIVVFYQIFIVSVIRFARDVFCPSGCNSYSLFFTDKLFYFTSHPIIQLSNLVFINHIAKRKKALVLKESVMRKIRLLSKWDFSLETMNEFSIFPVLDIFLFKLSFSLDVKPVWTDFVPPRMPISIRIGSYTSWLPNIISLSLGGSTNE